MATLTLRPNGAGDETAIEPQYPLSDFWLASTEYSVGDLRCADTASDTRLILDYECTTAGTSGATEPTWNTTHGATTSDGTVTWTCRNYCWNKVDEVTADDDTTYIKNDREGYYRDLFNLPASSGSGTINKITIYFRCKTSNYTNGHMKASIKSGTTVTDGDEKTVTTGGTWETFTQEWSTNPDDSEDWEWADIDALQIGFSLSTVPGRRASVAYCTQLYVEVDYEEATGTATQLYTITDGLNQFTCEQ